MVPADAVVLPSMQEAAAQLEGLQGLDPEQAADEARLMSSVDSMLSPAAAAAAQQQSSSGGAVAAA